jgi:hypothetical protein
VAFESRHHRWVMGSGLDLVCMFNIVSGFVKFS